MGDSKGVGNAGNWNNVISYNGIWPTAAGAGIHGNTGTNDYSPITLGYYPLWGLEVLVHPVNPGVDCRSEHHTRPSWATSTRPAASWVCSMPKPRTSPAPRPLLAASKMKSNERDLGSPGFATAIRLVRHENSRSAVGGLISPPFN